MAGLTSLNTKTVRGIYMPFKESGWSGATCVTRSFGAHKHMEVAQEVDLGSLPRLAATTSEEQIGGHWRQRPLPARPMEIECNDIEDADESESDSLDLTNEATRSEHPKTILEMWRTHPNYAPGMRLAQLTTFWITSGLPHSQFP